MTHAAVGVGEAVRVGHNLQVDVHPVQDGSEDGVTSVISHDLLRDVEETQQSVQQVHEQKLKRK